MDGYYTHRAWQFVRKMMPITIGWMVIAVGWAFLFRHSPLVVLVGIVLLWIGYCGFWLWAYVRHLTSL